MLYIDIEQIIMEMGESELIRITNPDGSSINIEKVESAVNAAESLIHAFLYGKYKLPFGSGFDLMVSRICIDIAIVNLYQMFSKSILPPIERLRRKAESIELLDIISRGQIRLGGSCICLINDESILSNIKIRKFGEEKLDQFQQFRS